MNYVKLMDKSFNYINNCFLNGKIILNYPEDEVIIATIMVALKSQIPKITKETQEGIDISYICPVCDSDNKLNYNYCWYCGQSIKNIEDNL